VTIVTNSRGDRRSEPRGASLSAALLAGVVITLSVVVAVLGWNHYRPAAPPDPKIVIMAAEPGGPGPSTETAGVR